MSDSHIKVTRLFPRTREEGAYLEEVAIFAARRCRTNKEHEPLMQEVQNYTDEKKANFLSTVIYQEWALDILEMIPLHFDIEKAPTWLTIQLLRHRLLWRDFSMEQQSQRAVPSGRLSITIPEEFQEVTGKYLEDIDEVIKANPHLLPENYRGVFPQGMDVNYVIGGNLRAFQHFFFMRCSKAKGGAGGAHPFFMEISDSMLDQTKEVYPIAMQEIIKA